MSLVPVPGAVILGAAVLGDDVHLCAATESVLGRIGAHLHVHFGNRVDVGGAAEVAAASGVAA